VGFGGGHGDVQGAYDRASDWRFMSAGSRAGGLQLGRSFALVGCMQLE
jgi:hypothetical protein